MRRLVGIRSLLTGALLCAHAALAQAPPVPAHPSELTYGPLAFEVPRAEQFRHVLPGGVVVYVVEDHTLPLVDLTLNLRAGAFREPAGKPGLAALTARLLRQGGTASMTPEQFDERVDFLAANLGASASPTGAQASLDVLSSKLDEGLALLFEMVKSPRFDTARLEIERGKVLEAMKQRNDDAGDIAEREWDWLLYGRDHFSARKATAAELAALTREDLIDFHRRAWGAQDLVIAVSGDVQTAKLLPQLERQLEGWLAGERSPWPPRDSAHVVRPGLYHVEKEIPQGKVSIGQRSVAWRDYADPEMYALMVMNDILGGGGFTARLMKRIRSDEGLAYGAYSQYSIGSYFPGTFEAGFASKNPTVALAAKITLEEIERIRREPVSAEELKVSKASFIDVFPRSFESPSRIASTFAADEILGRPHSYWYEYRRRIDAVTADRVLAAAQKYLRPEGLAMLVVGKWSEIEPGDAQGRARMSELFGGQVEHLPLRDPLTLAPLP